MRTAAEECVSVAEMLEKYRLHCEAFYRHPNGEPTGEAGTIGLYCRPLRELYSDRPAAEFGPLDLQVVRQHMIANRKWSRSFINAAVRKIVRAFRWAASQQIIPVSVVDALRTVDGLKAGRTEARESRPVVAVSDDSFSATLPHLPPIIRDMALIGRLTGCRPGEICAMRPADIDRSRQVWVYSPRLHKNSWRGKDRRVFIAADAQAILTPYLDRQPEAYCFSPAESLGRDACATNNCHRDSTARPACSPTGVLRLLA